MASAGSIAMTHQGGSTPGSVVPGVPVTVVTPMNVPAGAFNGSTVTSSTVTLPKNIRAGNQWANGRLVDAVLEFTISITTTDASLCALTVSPYFLRQYEVLAGGKSIENVGAPELYHNILATTTQQEFDTIRTACNMATDGSNLPTSYSLGSAGTGTPVKIYVPLWSGWLATQPYLAGFADDWTIRVDLAADIKPVATATATVNLVSLNLLTIHHLLDKRTSDMLDRQHRDGITYSGYSMQVVKPSTSSTWVNTAAQRLDLTQLANKNVAALAVYAGALASSVQIAAGSGGNQLRRELARSLEVRDGAGTILQEVTGTFVESFLAPHVLNTSSGMFLAQANVYWVPFCSNLNAVLETGEDTGSRKLEGNEYVNLTLAAASVANTAATVVAYKYLRLYVRERTVQTISDTVA